MPLPLGPLRNSALFSNHWLEKRLVTEPEWDDPQLRVQAQVAFDSIATLWSQQRPRVEHFGEQGLEYAFIQPVFEALGWKLNYQVHLRGRRPDYALFADDASLDAALLAGPQSEGFWQHPTILADAKAWT